MFGVMEPTGGCGGPLELNGISVTQRTFCHWRRRWLAGDSSFFSIKRYPRTCAAPAPGPNPIWQGPLGTETFQRTLMLLCEEYQRGPTAGQLSYKYTCFCMMYRNWAEGLQRSIRQVNEAGERLLVDYTGQTVPIVNA